MSKDELVLRIESLERQVQQLLFAMQSPVGEELDSGMRADEPDEKHRGRQVRGDFLPRVSDGKPPILQEPEPEAIPTPAQRTWQPEEQKERRAPDEEQPEQPAPPEHIDVTWQSPIQGRTERPPEPPGDEPEQQAIMPPERPPEWQPGPQKPPSPPQPDVIGEPEPQQPPEQAWGPRRKPKPDEIRGWETQPDIVDIDDIFGDSVRAKIDESDTKQDKGYEGTLLDIARDAASRYQDMLSELGTILQQVSDSMLGLRAQMQNTSAVIETSEQTTA